MNLFIFGLIVDTIGKILIGLSVLMVHRHIFKERKIDRDVLHSMRTEAKLTWIGILLIIIGSTLQLIFHL